MSTTDTEKQVQPATGALDRFFKISQRGSTVSREVRGGLVTFFAMAYILVVNPSILSAAAPESGPITTAAIAAGTALIAGLLTIAMGVFANFPMSMAAGMGLNAMVAFSLVGGEGLTYQEAMGLIFWEGLIILVLVLSGFREAVFRAVPQQLKSAISVGIGLFIAFVGLANAGIIRAGAGTPVQLGADGHLSGWPMAIFIFGLLLVIVLYVRKVKGAILFGIIGATILAFIVQAVAKVPGAGDDSPTGWMGTVPEFHGSPVSLPEFGTLGQVDFFGAFEKLGVLSVILLIFSLMLADFFDTMGTMVAVGAEGDLLDESGTPPHSARILMIDSLGAMAGGLGGVSSNTAYVESTAGVGEGARTGLASVVTGLLFLLALFFAPLMTLVPAEAASTALVFVGFLMMTQVTEIDWSRQEMALPAFLTIAMMPFSYSISVGIGVGFVSYTVIQIARGHARKIHPLMWVVAALFVVYFAMTPIQQLLLG
ncbi:NCS2 family permease [Actinomyces sp. F1_1611]